MHNDSDDAPRLRFPMPQERRCQFEKLAMGVVNNVVSQHSGCMRNEEIHINKGKWKLVKLHEGIKIFRARARNNDDVISQHCEPWTPTVQALCVGSIRGSLADAMYGAATPTESSMTAQSMLLHGQAMSQHKILQDIILPTVDEPFQYCGLKFSRTNTRSHLVKSRDYVFVEASGYLNVLRESRSERVGYILRHSIDAAELDEASGSQAIRGRISLCWIFREPSSNCVEVYGILKSNPGGSLPTALAMKSAVRALAESSAFTSCSLNKKLAWLLERGRGKQNKEEPTVLLSQLADTSWSCVSCGRKVSSLSSLVSCSVCGSTICSRCITNRTVVTRSAAGNLNLEPMTVCVGCLSMAMHQLDSSHLATEEFVLDQHEASIPHLWKLIPETRNELRSSISLEETFVMDFSNRTGQSNPANVRTLTSDDSSDFKAVVLISGRPEASEVGSAHFSIEEQGIGRARRTCSALVSVSSYSEFDDDSGVESEFDDGIEVVAPMQSPELEYSSLVRRMQEIRIQAEMAYIYTKKQSAKLQRSRLYSNP